MIKNIFWDISSSCLHYYIIVVGLEFLNPFTFIWIIAGKYERGCPEVKGWDEGPETGVEGLKSTGSRIFSSLLVYFLTQLFNRKRSRTMTRTSVCLSALTPTRLSSRRRENPIWTVMRPLQPEPLSMGMGDHHFDSFVTVCHVRYSTHMNGSAPALTPSARYCSTLLCIFLICFQS